MFVSAGHGEGTTTIATIFASILARNTKSRVLLVDGNIRTPSLNHIFALGNNPGLFDLVFDDAEMDNVIRKTHLSNLSVIIGGHMNSYGSYVFDYEFMNNLVGKLKENYNYIIFDSAPVNIYGDPAILAPQLDGIVLVVQAEKTKIEEVQRAKRQLERVDGKILGVVLNRKKSHVPNFINNVF
jgi:capsular exopolysaccharide synthesis family protein